MLFVEFMGLNCPRSCLHPPISSQPLPHRLFESEAENMDACAVPIPELGTDRVPGERTETRGDSTFPVMARKFTSTCLLQPCHYSQCVWDFSGKTRVWCAKEENMNFPPGELTVQAWGAACLLWAVSTLAMREARIPSSSGMVIPDVCSQIPGQELHPGKTVAATSHGFLLPTVCAACEMCATPRSPTPTRRTKMATFLKDIIPRGGL